MEKYKIGQELVICEDCWDEIDRKLEEIEQLEKEFNSKVQKLIYSLDNLALVGYKDLLETYYVNINYKTKKIIIEDYEVNLIKSMETSEYLTYKMAVKSLSDISRLLKVIRRNKTKIIKL